MPYESNDEFLQALGSLIDGWCNKRALRPLSRVLGPYLSFNGLTDGWAELARGLKSVRAQDRDMLTAEEIATINDLIRVTDTAIYGNKVAN
jgi:hypothetical protein